MSKSAFIKGGLYAVAVFAVALVTRLALVAHPPIYDELYQLLPAKSFLENGTFQVLDGVYDRASLFTRLIAASYQLAGEQSVAVARFIPSVLPAALMITLFFVWARHAAGTVAALIAAFFLVFWPNGIEVAQYIRFYSLHGLFFVSGAILVYVAFVDIDARRWPLRAGVLAVAAVLLLLALNLQMLTALGIAGMLLWVAIALLPGWLRAQPRLWYVLAALVVVAGLMLASGSLNAQLAKAWTIYNWEPWPVQNDRFFYHRDFRDNYPSFWPLYPVAALIALKVNFRLGAYCLCLFATTFVLQSFGGLKNIRYLYGTMPFFFLTWGMVVQALLPVLRRYLTQVAGDALAPLLPKRALGLVAPAVLVVAAVFFVFANAAFERSLRLSLGKDQNQLLGKTRWVWPQGGGIAAPWVGEGAIVVTTEEMRAIDSLGDFDLAYNKPRFSEMLFSKGDATRPFDHDLRSGRPLVAELSDVSRVMNCYAVGIVLSDAPWARSPNAVDLLQDARARGIWASVQQDQGMAMLAWRRDGPAPATPECLELKAMIDAGASARILAGDSVAQAVSSSASADR